MYIYKITNLKTKEFYIGKRSAYNGSWFDDNYMGSGLVVVNLWVKKSRPIKKDILFAFTGSDLSDTFLSQVEGMVIRWAYNDELCVNIGKGTMPSYNFFDSFNSKDVLIHENEDVLGLNIFSRYMYNLKTAPHLFEV